MSYEGFYRYIYKHGDKYRIIKGNEIFLICNTLSEALYERDRLVGCNWDWEAYVHLPDTINGYIHIDLPPFNHRATYITHINEYWIVLSKGRNPRYYGCYHSFEEAETVMNIYKGRIVHRKDRWRVQRKINGKMMHFGNYDTKQEAIDRVKELEKNGWKK